MEYGCPLCNGFVEAEEYCLWCGHLMTDTGKMENYYGPYSPYDNMDQYEPPYCWGSADTESCVHFFSCPVCGSDKKIGVPEKLL